MDLRAADAAPHKERWPSAAQRIAEARSRARLSEQQIAHRLNVTTQSYWDLENYDDEAFTAISLATLTTLGGILGVEPRELLLGADAKNIDRTVTFSAISARLAERLRREGMTVEQLEDRIGWNIEPVLIDPHALSEFNVEALYNICTALDLDWVAALPSRPATL
jgi:transcriptional regulator with XRE-family HTH domain